MPKKKWLSEELKHLENKGSKEFVRKLQSNKEKSLKAIQLLFENLGQEARETQDASKIMVKYLKGGNISKEEEKELKSQIVDIFKAVGIGIPFVLIPGSSLLLPFLVKMAEKKGIKLLPTAFNDSEKKNEIESAESNITDEENK